MSINGVKNVLIVAVVEGDCMDIYTVSLFGHRKIDNLRNLEERLGKITRELIRTKRT